MNWRVKGFLYWLAALSAYVAGWQSYEWLKKAGLDQTIALTLGVVVGLGVLGAVVVIYFKWKRAHGGSSERAHPTRGGDSEMLNERQQRLMAALQQAVQTEGDAVIQTTDGEDPEYIVETTSSDKERFRNP